MMKKNGILLVLGTCCLLVACSPVKMPIEAQYKLLSYSAKREAHSSHATILVSQPEAVADYQTEQMLYIKKPYELNHFAHNAWVTSPPNMLYPLILLSLEQSHYFAAVASGAYADKTDYRLDTQLLAFQQNFLFHPSRMEFKAKVTLSHVDDGQVIASEIISQHIKCQEDTPYGGVVAANLASLRFTKQVTQFAIRYIEQDRKRKRS